MIKLLVPTTGVLFVLMAVPCLADEAPVPTPRPVVAAGNSEPTPRVPSINGRAVLGGMQERLNRRRQDVNRWSNEATQQIVFSVMVGLLGLVVGVVQGTDKKWAKGLTVGLGFTVSAITLFTDKVYPADYRTLQRSVNQAMPIIEDLQEAMNEFDPTWTPENQTTAEAGFLTKCGQVDLIGHRLLGVDPSDAKLLKAASVFFGIRIVHAQSDKAAPSWVQAGTQTDKAFVYFAGRAENESLSEARTASLDYAANTAAHWLTGRNPNQNSSKPTPQLLDLIQHSADVADTWYTYDRNKKTYSYFTRLRLTNEFETLNLNGLEVESKLGSGVGPFRFGMTQKEVNALLPHPFGDAPLPVAVEYRSAEARYFWVYAREFLPPASAGSPFAPLQAFQPCWGGPNSYVTFFFIQTALARISVRFFSDCADRNRLAQKFAESYFIPATGRSDSLGYRRILNSATIEIRLARNSSTVEIFKTGSPVPADSFWDTL